MDLQAMARVHRIGQEKTVHVSQASSHDDGLYQNSSHYQVLFPFMY